jgi:hypothetical protein
MFKLSIPSFLLCLVLLISCSKERISCFTPPEPTLIRLVDKDGIDLLDPSNPNGYKLSAISLYYMEDGRKVPAQVTLDSIPNGNAYFLNTDISWKADRGRDFVLSLSSTITDRIYLRYDEVSEKQCAFFRFVEFKYNDVVYSKKKIAGNLDAFEIVR